MEVYILPPERGLAIEGADAESGDSRDSPVRVHDVEPEQGSLRQATAGHPLLPASMPRLKENGRDNHTHPCQDGLRKLWGDGACAYVVRGFRFARMG